jgi:hypothetical protein
MPNIKLFYLYRDSGNYKKFGSFIFHNPLNISLEEFGKLVNSKLIDGQWFYTFKWGLPDLHFDKWDKELDHCLHEFEGIEYAGDSVIADFSIDELIERFKIISIYH